MNAGIRALRPTNPGFANGRFSVLSLSMDLNIAGAGAHSDERPASVEISGDVMMIERAFDQHFAIGCYRT